MDNADSPLGLKPAGYNLTISLGENNGPMKRLAFHRTTLWALRSFLKALRALRIKKMIAGFSRDSRLEDLAH